MKIQNLSKFNLSDTEYNKAFEKAVENFSDSLKGGLGDRLSPEDVDRRQLFMGTKVEFEHTNDINIAMEIALDHLEEIPDYYTRLAKMERDAEDNPYVYDELLLDYLKDYIDQVDDNWNYITPEDLEENGVKNYFLLDIRKKEDFESGHIKGAKNIFWMDLVKEENLKKIPKDKTVVLICYVGHTASQMLVALRLLGFDNVVVLKFGMGISPVEGIPVAGWSDFGFEMVK